MNNGTPCSSQLIWCETRVEKLEQQIKAALEAAYSEAEKVSAFKRELTASQAREKVFRGRLEYVDSYLEADGGFGHLRGDIAIELKMPTDDTALKAALAAERDRCKKALTESSWYSPLDIAEAIDALKD